MHPWEFWQIATFNRPRKTYGSMTEEEVEDIYEETYGRG